jgi:arylsulfatase A-like enzyme
MFAGKKIPESPTLFDDYATRTDAIRECRQKVLEDLRPGDTKGPPPAGLKGDALKRWKYQRYLQDYLACVQSVDDNVGRLLDYLDQSGLSKNTIVIYTSDQGMFLGDHGLYDKRFMYEESIRMPFLVRWPGVVKPGSVQDAMAINVDFAPTFLDIAGLKVPADMQGRSLVPLFNGKRPADWRTSWYYRYYHDPGNHNTRAHYGVRTETHKLIYFWKKNQWEMYDLVNDPHELHNLYTDPSQAGMVDKLKAELYRLKKELQDNDEFARAQPPDDVSGKPKKTKKVKKK